MSGKLVVDIWSCGYGDASTILLLMAIADQANDQGENSLDINTIARKARQSPRNCQYLLRKLEALEVIERFEAKGRTHTNSYRIRMENLKNMQPLQVLENMQTVQPLQVLDQEKHANGATIAGFSVPEPLPFPSDSPSLRQDQTQREEKTQRENNPPTPHGEEEKNETRRTKRYMPQEETAQKAMLLSFANNAFIAWHSAHYAQANIHEQWEWFVRYCLSGGKQYVDFRAAFMNSFGWEGTPAQPKGMSRRPQVDHANGVPLTKSQAREQYNDEQMHIAMEETARREAQRLGTVLPRLESPWPDVQ